MDSWFKEGEEVGVDGFYNPLNQVYNGTRGTIIHIATIDEVKEELISLNPELKNTENLVDWLSGIEDRYGGFYKLSHIRSLVVSVEDISEDGTVNESSIAMPFVYRCYLRKFHKPSSKSFKSILNDIKDRNFSKIS